MPVALPNLDESLLLIALSAVIATLALAVAIYRRVRAQTRQLSSQIELLRNEHALARQRVAERTSTVDRLLDFSQTVQGAGHPEQVIETLTHFLQSELSLAGIVVLGNEVETGVDCRSRWPLNVLREDSNIRELDASYCPCMRQNLPRCFKPDSPVRCPVDDAISLPKDHAAYCIPITVSRQTQLLVHMILPADRSWTEERRQLAQAYVNSATSVLVSLHLLAEAEKQSMTDPLTGLYNRRSLDQFLVREIALAERHHHPLSMVMLDMDHFKTVNDEHGHAAGDHVLKAFADCVRMTLRKTDLAFRFGGDEFAIVLPQTGIAQAQQVVNKLRQAFSAIDFTDAVANLRTQPTLSIGVAERSRAMNVLTLSQLLNAADQALYQAKQSRNCTSLYAPQAA